MHSRGGVICCFCAKRNVSTVYRRLLPIIVIVVLPFFVTLMWTPASVPLGFQGVIFLVMSFTLSFLAPLFKLYGSQAHS